MATVECHVDDLADEAQVMPRPLKFGRVKQTPAKQQTNEPHTGYLAPMTLTGAFETPPARIPRY